MNPSLKAPPSHPMAGFTLIEVLITLLVSAGALLGVAAMGMQALRTTMHAQFISEATMLARDLEARCKLDRNSLFAGGPTALPDYPQWLDLVRAHLPVQQDPTVEKTDCPDTDLNMRCFTATFTWTAPATSQDSQNQGGPAEFTYTHLFAVIMPP